MAQFKIKNFVDFTTKEFIDTIKGLNPRQVVYVSCDPTTPVRNLQYFSKIGYHTKDMYLYDMFPHIGHEESIIKLVR